MLHMHKELQRNPLGAAIVSYAGPDWLSLIRGRFGVVHDLHATATTHIVIIAPPPDQAGDLIAWTCGHGQRAENSAHWWSHC